MAAAHHDGATGVRIDRDDDRGFSLTSWGERSKTRISAADTGGRLAVLNYGAPAGFGPPRHLHRDDDEIFIIQTGHIVLWTPYETRTAQPGDVVLLSRQIPHTW